MSDLPRLSSRPAIIAMALLALAAAQPAAAQQSPSWFVPNQAPAASPRPAQARPQPRPAPAPAYVPPPPVSPLTAAPSDQAEQTPISVPLPPAPVIPPVDKGAAPPAAVIGVLGVPEVMHASTAAQQVERVIGERRDRLNAEAQKEQLAWRDLQQALVAQRASLNPDQIRTRERELQDRITNAQKTFRDRNTMIQQAAQYSLGQIERTMIGVIRIVAESRGMNLVLHRAQVALNVNEFDITAAVGDELNKALPSVEIPAEGTSLADVAKKLKQTVATTPAPTQAAQATPTPPPAAAPAPNPAAPAPATPAPKR